MQTPKFLSKNSVLKIHARQVEKFGGTPGIRDQGLLESALAQPQATFDGELLHQKIHEQAAAYLYHLAMNHPFIDGNKRTKALRGFLASHSFKTRTAFAATDTFLRLNGYSLTLTDEEAYNLVLQVAQGKISKDELTANLEQSVAMA